MSSTTSKQKKEILAQISDFPVCGFSSRITGNICHYFRSFVGRDFKAWMQMAVFIVHPYLSEEKKMCWFHLAKVTLISTYSEVKEFMYMYTAFFDS